MRYDIKMKEYDSLPKEYRDLLKYAFNPDIVNLKTYDLKPVSFFSKQDRILQRQKTVATYGPEHPQAK